MVTDLRKSLDTALQLDHLLRVKLGVMGAVINTEPALEDALVVFIAEVYNQTVAQIAGLALQIENITEQLKLFGEVGFEKELEFQPEESDDEAA